jgi:hypothetical protein
MNTAQKIVDESMTEIEAMETAANCAADIDQDWDREATVYTFHDGSKMEVSGTDFYSVEA